MNNIRRKRRSWSRYPVVDGQKECSQCHVTKPLADFHPIRKGEPKLHTWCKGCKAAQRQERSGRDDPTAEARFWAKVEKTEGCWNWIAGKDDRGYGFFYFRGENWRAHRVSMVFAGHDLPKGSQRNFNDLVVDHMCKNLACVRPDHLRLITQEDNVQKYADRRGQPEKLRAYQAAKRGVRT